MKKYILNTENLKIMRIMTANSPLLISSGSTNMMVDSGLKKNWGSIQKSLDNTLTGGNLDYLIITHAHYNCVENAAAIKEKYSPKVIIHKNEASYLKDGVSSPLAAWAYKKGAKINDCPSTKHYFDSIEPDILVNDELSLVPYGINGWIIATPGHSVGSISIILGDIALTGDALSGMKKKPYAKSINVASQIAESTWQKLISFDLKRYIPMHGNVEYAANDIKSLYNGYRELVDKI